MTTPRIEEIIEEFEQQMPLMRAHGKLLCATASPSTYKKIKDWLRTALTQAHQAGIDEAVELLKSKREDSKQCRACGKHTLDKSTGLGKVAFEYQCTSCGNYQEETSKVNQALDDTIKALQDNK